MKILITGATGTLGQELAQQLLQKNHQLFCTIRSKNIPAPLSNPKCTTLDLDLTQFDPNALPKDIDAIYYLAQSRHYREFPEKAQDIFEINITAPLKLAQWAVQQNIPHFHYASSGGIYDDTQNTPVKEFFDINANNNKGFYLSTKLSAEILLKNFAEFFRSFSIIRPFFIYGPNQHENMLIPRLVNQVITQTPISIQGKEGININPIHVQDAAKACAKLLNTKGHNVFNIAGQEIISLKALLTLIGELTRTPPIINSSEGESPKLIADITTMKENLHTPSVTLKEGLAQLINRSNEATPQ